MCQLHAKSHGLLQCTGWPCQACLPMLGLARKAPAAAAKPRQGSFHKRSAPEAKNKDLPHHVGGAARHPDDCVLRQLAALDQPPHLRLSARQKACYTVRDRRAGCAQAPARLLHAQRCCQFSGDRWLPCLLTRRPPARPPAPHLRREHARNHVLAVRQRHLVLVVGQLLANLHDLRGGGGLSGGARRRRGRGRRRAGPPAAPCPPARGPRPGAWRWSRPRCSQP